MPTNATSINLTKIEDLRDNVQYLAELTMEELVGLRRETINNKGMPGITAAMIQAAMMNHVLGKKSVPQVMMPHQMYSLGVTQTSICEDGENKFVYSGLDLVRKELGMASESNKDIVTVPTIFGYPDYKPVVPILEHLNASVVTNSTVFMHACRLIATYYKHTTTGWQTTINSASRSPFRDISHLPTRFDRVSMYLSALSLAKNMQGTQLYYYLTSLRRPAEKNLIVKAASEFQFANLITTDKVPIVRKNHQLKIGDKKEVASFPCASASLQVNVPIDQQPDVDMITVYSQRLTAIEQKFGGSNLSSVNNEFFDGVHLGSPDSWHRLILKGVANIKRVDAMKRILIVATDVLFVKKVARVLLEMKFTGTLYVRGIAPGGLEMPGVTIFCGKGGFLSTRYCLVVLSDFISRPSMDKKNATGAAYHTKMSVALGDHVKDYGDSVVFLMCPYVTPSKIVDYKVRHLRIFDATSPVIPILVQKKEVVVKKSVKISPEMLGSVMSPGGVVVDESNTTISSFGWDIRAFYKLMIVSYSALIQYPWCHVPFKVMIKNLGDAALLDMVDDTNYRSFFAKEETIITENGSLFVMVPILGRLDIDMAIETGYVLSAKQKEIIEAKQTVEDEYAQDDPDEKSDADDNEEENDWAGADDFQ